MNERDARGWLARQVAPGDDPIRYLLAAGLIAASQTQAERFPDLFQAAPVPRPRVEVPLRTWADPRDHPGEFAASIGAQLVMPTEGVARIAFESSVADDLRHLLVEHLRDSASTAVVVSTARPDEMAARPWDVPIRLAVDGATAEEIGGGDDRLRALIEPVGPSRRRSPQMMVGSPVWVDRWLDTHPATVGAVVVVGDTSSNRPAGYEQRAAVWIHLPEAVDPLDTALELVFHLSHNHSLDEAVARTAFDSPYEILADPGYLDRTRLTDAIDLAVGLEDLLRVEEAMTSAEPPPPPAPPTSAPRPQDIPRPPRRSLPDLPAVDREPAPAIPTPSIVDDFGARPFEHETHDAADAAARLDDLRRRTSDREHRFLAASSQLLAPDADGARARLEIDILPQRLQADDQVAAPERFPDERLDWRGGDVPLDIVLFELREGGQARRDRVLLPAVGQLREPARFEITWPGGPFEARVAVLHRQRFVQTMLLTVSDDGLPPSFETECVVRAANSDLSDLESHQASIILNDHNGPRTMVSTEVGQVINAPRDIASARDGIKTQLLKIFDDPDDYRSIDSEPFQALLTQLVLQGVKIRKNLFTGEATGAVADRAVYESLRSAERISVLSATVTEILPLEYVYDPEFVPPLAGSAPICPTALAAIRRSAPGHDLDADPGPTLAQLRSDCGHVTDGATCGADATMICPLGFWGFRKVIERHTNRVGHDLDAGFAVSTSPTAARPSIDISSVLAAATPKADAFAAEWTAARTALQQRLHDRFKLVDGWQPIAADLIDEATHRGVLLLVPHLDKEADNENLILDLGTSPHLALDRIDALQIRNDAPLVLLLGCSTGEGSSPSEEFPASFLNAGAAIVLATMTMVLGRLIGPLAERLMTLLLERAASDDQPLFGETLLDLRQELLGTNPIVLTLIAYGDADWILTSSLDPDGN